MNAVVINVFLTICWLVLGLYFLLYEHLNGEPLRYRLPIGGINPGWLAILFAAFNAYRGFWNWWYRRRRRQQRAEEEEFRRQFERRHERPREPAGPPDPNFIFTERPPVRSPDEPT